MRYPVTSVTRLPTWLFVLAASATALGQQAVFDRLPPERLDVPPPSARVNGAPGRMAVRDRECRPRPAADVRRRIVDLAVQEWAYFGFPVVDQTDDGEAPAGSGRREGRGWPRRGGDADSARVASSIAGYWAVTPDGAWILDAQNAIWREPGRETDRWRYPWSAAFVSWVMCESGLSATSQFQRAVAHHTYIDQAIRARDGGALRAAFAAFDAGERAIAPGDLLCTARRPAYRTLGERRRQMGEGARTHCDIVVKVDAAAARLFAIGGNVRGTVGLKAMPLERAAGVLRVVTPDNGRGRAIFAHLRLADAYAPADVFDASPAVRALGCGRTGPAAWRTAAELVAPGGLDCAQ